MEVASRFRDSPLPGIFGPVQDLWSPVRQPTAHPGAEASAGFLLEDSELAQKNTVRSRKGAYFDLSDLATGRRNSVQLR